MHVLLVNHGKRCPRCAKNGKPRKESDGDCPLFGCTAASSAHVKGTDITNKSSLKQDPDMQPDSETEQSSNSISHGSKVFGKNERSDVKLEAVDWKATVKPDLDIKAEPSNQKDITRC